MENYLQSVMNQAQGRAPNTIKLRKLYTDYAFQTQERGETPLDFEQWARMNYPDQYILNTSTTGVRN